MKMMKFQVFLLVCLPFIAKAVFIPVNNDENAFHGSQYTSFPLQPAFNLQRSSYDQPQSRLIPLPGFGNIRNLLFPNKLTLSDIFQLKRIIKNLDTIIETIRNDVQRVQMQVQAAASRLAALVAAQTVSCPVEYEAVNGSCYWFQPTPTIFTVATCPSNGFLALPELSLTNDAFGINIKNAFPIKSIIPFFIGVRSTATDVLQDLDENIIAIDNPRFVNNPTPINAGLGVFVTISALNPGDWTTTVTSTATNTLPYLCQTNPI